MNCYQIISNRHDVKWFSAIAHLSKISPKCSFMLQAHIGRKVVSGTKVVSENKVVPHNKFLTRKVVPEKVLELKLYISVTFIANAHYSSVF